MGHGQSLSISHKQAMACCASARSLVCSQLINHLVARTAADSCCGKELSVSFYQSLIPIHSNGILGHCDRMSADCVSVESNELLTLNRNWKTLASASASKELDRTHYTNAMQGVSLIECCAVLCCVVCCVVIVRVSLIECCVALCAVL